MVEKNIKWYKSYDTEDIFYQVWAKSEGEPCGLLQIVHGYAEYVDRYDEFARFMAEQGFIVYGQDHRGHGRTKDKNDLRVHMAEDDGFEKVVEDNFKLTLIMKKEYPDLPIFILGHSMGSFITRRYIQKYGDEINGVILSGTGENPAIALKFANFLANRHVKSKGPEFEDDLLDKLVFGQLNNGIKNGTTGLEWICTRKEVVYSFYRDPLRGRIATSAFFRDFTSALLDIQNPDEIDNIPLELPVLFISGSEDPVGGKKCSGVKKAHAAMEKAGMQDVSLVLYDGLRHEILNETRRKEVIYDILGWIQRRL